MASEIQELKFCLILINLNWNNHMWLVPIVLNSTGQKDIFRTTLRILLVTSLSIFEETVLELKREWVMVEEETEYLTSHEIK